MEYVVSDISGQRCVVQLGRLDVVHGTKPAQDAYPLEGSAGGPRPADPSLLDNRTLLGNEHESWRVRLYPEAREAVLWRTADPGPSQARRSARQPGSLSGWRPRRTPGGPDPEAEDRERSRRRARGRLRRYAVANRCTRLVTLTYAEGVYERAKVVEDWNAFARALRAAGYGQAWVRALELHPGGHGFHIHAGFSRWVDWEDLLRLWRGVVGAGGIDIRKMRSRRGGREDARLAAGYLAKYAGKAAVAAPGEHSYEVAQGYPVIPVEVEYATRAGLEELLLHRQGEPVYRWTSAEDPDWRGPPAAYWAW